MAPPSPPANSGLLRFVFFGLVVPAAALMRLIGVDPMGLRRTAAPSYWKRRRKGVRMTSQF